MRRTSVSLPTKQIRRDPHEKADRYEAGHREVGILEKLKQAGMNPAQKSRWLKTTAIVISIFFLFYYLSPRGVNYYQGTSVARDCPRVDMIVVVTNNSPTSSPSRRSAPGRFLLWHRQVHEILL